MGGGIGVGTKVGVSEGASEKNSEGIAGRAVRLRDGDWFVRNSRVGSTELRRATGTEGKNATGELKTSSSPGSFALSSICEGCCEVEAGATSEGANAVDPVDGFEEGTFDATRDGFDKGFVVGR